MTTKGCTPTAERNPCSSGKSSPIRTQKDICSNRSSREKDGKNTGVKTHGAGGDKEEKQKKIHTTKFTCYMQKEGHTKHEPTSEWHSSTKQAAEERQEKSEIKLRKKLTRKTILDMVKSRHLTREEGEIELKGLEGLDTENNQNEIQQLPERDQTKRRARKKITKKAILDMLRSGHLTQEECRMELMELEVKEEEASRRPKHEPPENTSRST